MIDIASAKDSFSLRAHLRDATRVAHNSLDRSMSSVGWGSRKAYTRFLQIQHAARSPIETWITAGCPDEIAPPNQTGLIAQDLDALSADRVDPVKRFVLPFQASPIGAVWALSGSSLGNKVIARSLIETLGHDMPVQFLGSETMSDFWKSLLPALDLVPSPHEIGPACDAALAVFDHFLETIDGLHDRQAA